MSNWKIIILLAIAVLTGCATKVVDTHSTSADVAPSKPTYVQAIEVKYVVLYQDNKAFVATSFDDYLKQTAYINDLIRYIADANAVISYYEESHHVDAQKVDVLPQGK